MAIHSGSGAPTALIGPKDGSGPLPLTGAQPHSGHERYRSRMNDNDKQNGPDNGGGNPWMKHLLIWVGMLAALALFVTMFGNGATAPSGNSIAYSAFLDKREAGDGKEVNIAPGMITGGLNDQTKSRTNTPADPQLVERLRARNVQITARPEETPSVWLYLLYQSLPFLLFLGIAFFVLRQMQKNSGSGGVGCCEK